MSQSKVMVQSGEAFTVSFSFVADNFSDRLFGKSACRIEAEREVNRGVATSCQNLGSWFIYKIAPPKHVSPLVSRSVWRLENRWYWLVRPIETYCDGHRPLEGIINNSLENTNVCWRKIDNKTLDRRNS